MRSATSRGVNVDQLQGSLPRVTGMRLQKTTAPAARSADAAADFIFDLLRTPEITHETALRALTRLRERLHAAHAAVWLIRDAAQICVLRSGSSEHDETATTVEPAEHAILTDRLRRHGWLWCGPREISGLETLVPRGIRSYGAGIAPAESSDVALLLCGWTTVKPAADEMAVPHLRVATALLQRAFTDHQPKQRVTAEAVVASLGDALAVLDRNGVILAVNTVWTREVAIEGTPFELAVGPGANYLDICRDGAAKGRREAADLLEGINAVINGVRATYTGQYSCATLGDRRFCVVTATPLQHPDGGAIVTHTTVTHRDVIELAGRIGETRFDRLVDAIAAPICIAAPNGSLIRGNECWMAMVGGHTPSALPHPCWTDLFHPDDRARATMTFDAAVAMRAPLNLELRLNSTAGTDRTCVCFGVPQVGIDGDLERYVLACRDITEQRQIESTLSAVASKVVAAEEAERRRVGRELHDDLGQQAALLGVKLEALARSDLSRAKLREGIVDAEKSVNELATAIHNLSHQLHPAKLRLLGLVQTVESLCREVSRQAGIEVRFTPVTVPDDVPEATALCIFRVTQEALQNALKHSGARDIEVTLTANRSSLTMCVADNGRGLDPLAAEGRGIGFLTMRERVELSGGSFQIDGGPGGTTICATLPLATASPANEIP